ncbi:SH3 domain-containing protein [Actinomadura sp. WMMA1423]|uniref:SH3 domain-containing protein n=1 Tax=Actinomadura sp. WMMA1423 TaxID=2591108 RepID=UPI0011463A0D|nr:SH3 domain-containing protein [Actinomadura sp. WMMA1423]
MALAVAGAASGLTLLAGGTAAGSATHARPATPVDPDALVCRYEVTAKDGLEVRKTPGGAAVGALPYAAHIGADCETTGWTQLRQGVKAEWIGDWVSRTYLKRIGCGHTVTAKDGLPVYTDPDAKSQQIGTLDPGTRINTSCTSKNGFFGLEGGVKLPLIGGWVSGSGLTAGNPVGGVLAGGGGTSTPGLPLLAGAGLGILALGGGIVLVTRRRQAKAAS